MIFLIIQFPLISIVERNNFLFRLISSFRECKGFDIDNVCKFKIIHPLNTYKVVVPGVTETENFKMHTRCTFVIMVVFYL